ncbi:MAG: glycosyltransferase family 2 protein [Gorillibacterium sp.]|nr:glycosyltransferase family 2 protein [Gorillibacterium sp.]
MKAPLTSIIIPTYNGIELLRECIGAIRTYTPEPHEIIVVDNGSVDETISFCRQEKLTFISLPYNTGFPEACNRGLRLAVGDTLLLLNNDVIVSHNWLGNMLACLNADEATGAVAPYSNRVSGIQLLDSGYETVEEFHRIAETRNSANSTLWVQTERLVGMCFLFKRAAMNRIGLLDEQFAPGLYEDDDYCYRLRLAEYKLMLAGDVIVHHYGSMSFKKTDPAIMEELIRTNQDKFRNKWGIDPREFHSPHKKEGEFA